MKQLAIAFVALFVGLLAVRALSNQAYEDEQLERKLYCENVNEGVWPEYKGHDDYLMFCASSKNYMKTK